MTDEYNAEKNPGWKRGPMPTGTYYWGAVVVYPQLVMGFQFCGFNGDHVIIANEERRRIERNEIAWYNNSIGLPPHPLHAPSEEGEKLAMPNTRSEEATV